MRRLLWVLPLLLVGCASDMDLGNGRVLNLAKVEARSCFGVNDSRSRLRECTKTTDPNDITRSIYTDCHWMESEWGKSSSPGQCGQVVQGALQGIGLGVAGSLIGGGSNAATATSSSAVTTVTKGGK